MDVLGSAVIISGLILILLGVLLTVREMDRDRGPTDFVQAIRDLVVEIGRSGRPSLGCFAFGVILIFLGGLISGISGLTG